MLLSQLFPHKFCINLDRRPDRWERMQEEFARHGIDGVQRFSAVDGSAVVLPPHWRHTAGAYGCLLSHVAVIEEARALNAESVLIFEDDTVFDPEFMDEVCFVRCGSCRPTGTCSISERCIKTNLSD